MRSTTTSRTVQGITILIMVFVLALSSCQLLPGKKTEQTAPAAGTQQPPPVEKKSTRTAPPQRPSTERVLAGLPAREQMFLGELEKRVEAGDWEWVVSHADRAHREALMGSEGMDQESYLSFLFQLGAAPPETQDPDLREPGYFSPYSTVDLVYTGFRQTPMETIVTGYLYNGREKRVDFTLEVLGQLQDIMITGPYN